MNWVIVGFLLTVPSLACWLLMVAYDRAEQRALDIIARLETAREELAETRARLETAENINAAMEEAVR